MANPKHYVDNEKFFKEVKKGDRIAQLVISPMTQAKLEEVYELNKDDDRGGGLGSTGVK